MKGRGPLLAIPAVTVAAAVLAVALVMVNFTSAGVGPSHRVLIGNAAPAATPPNITPVPAQSPIAIAPALPNGVEGAGTPSNGEGSIAVAPITLYPLDSPAPTPPPQCTPGPGSPGWHHHHRGDECPGGNPAG